VATVPLGRCAEIVEKFIHAQLEPYRTRGGTEWFDIGVDDALKVVHACCKVSSLSMEEGVTIEELQRRSEALWLAWKPHATKPDSSEIHDRSAREDLEASHPDPIKGGRWTDPPAMIELVASAFDAKPSSVGFNDVLLSTEEGMRIRWHIERSLGEMPSGKKLAPYLSNLNPRWVEDANQLRSFASRKWIEWSLGRDLTPFEAALLSRVWDAMVTGTRASRSEGEKDLSEDKVQDNTVCAKAIIGDIIRGDRDKVEFAHPAFKVILMTETGSSIHGASGELIPIGNTRAIGFIRPHHPDLERTHFLAWTQQCVKTMDEAFLAFLGEPKASQAGICFLPLVDDPILA
jgi:hypothetical protein